MSIRHQKPSRLPRLWFGVPYYPEHWTEAERKEDAVLMREAGVNVVRMAEFAWDRMEPSEGVFDFTLFAQVATDLGTRGIDTLLCTPTAAPPRWLTFGKDQWLRVDVNGRPMQHGNRQHVCTNQPAFREASRRITRAMAEHFRDHPHVLGWQTDNEFHCHFSVCYCEACQAGFRDWLRVRYGKISELNRAWGTAFWAQTYDNFEQIELPRPPARPAYVNPSQDLDHRRFLSDSLCAFQREQVKILREANPGWRIFHNGVFEHIDNWDLSSDLDFFGVDVYQGFAVREPLNWVWGAYKNEQCRYVSGGYIVPEQNGGAGGQYNYMLPTPAPGQMRLWAYQALARGADGVLHFRWRTCRFGAEMYWNGILDHDNIPRRRYEEFAREGAEFRRISDAVVNSLLEVRIGILLGYEHCAAHATQANGFPSPDDQANAVYTELALRHLPAGLVEPRDAFDGLEILVVPSYIPGTPELAAKLENFVQAGGTLLVTGRTFTRNTDNQVIAETPPGLLRNLLGVTREEEGRLEEENVLRLNLDGRGVAVQGGYEILEPEGAEIIGVWSRVGGGTAPHAAEGRAGLTRHAVGRGFAWTFGGYLSGAAVSPVLDRVLADRPVHALAEASLEVEVTLRHRGDTRLLFLLNHGLNNADVRFTGAGTDLLTETRMEGTACLEPREVVILRLESDK